VVMANLGELEHQDLEPDPCWNRDRSWTRDDADDEADKASLTVRMRRSVLTLTTIAGETNFADGPSLRVGHDSLDRMF
jgi:hypothetical protein